MDLKTRSNQANSAPRHNGFESIDSQIGSGYNRIRIRGRTSMGSKERCGRSRFIGFSKANRSAGPQNLEIVIDNIGVLIRDGINAFSTKLGWLLINKKGV